MMMHDVVVVVAAAAVAVVMQLELMADPVVFSFEKIETNVLWKKA